MSTQSVGLESREEVQKKAEGIGRLRIMSQGTGHETHIYVLGESGQAEIELAVVDASVFIPVTGPVVARLTVHVVDLDLQADFHARDDLEFQPVLFRDSPPPGWDEEAADV